MRLIDADALAEEITKNMENGFPANEYLSLYALSCIAHAPTVDVLEQIQADIYEEFMTIDGGVHDVSALKCMEIIDKYKGG